MRGIVWFSVTAPVIGSYFTTRPNDELALAPMYTRLATVLSVLPNAPGTGGVFSAKEIKVGILVTLVKSQ